MWYGRHMRVLITLDWTICGLVASWFVAAGVKLFQWGRGNGDWVCVLLGVYAVLIGVTIVLTLAFSAE